MFERRRMKVLAASVLSCLLISACSNARPLTAESHAQKLHHVAVIWLKAQGDESLIKQYIEASRRFAQLPGVVSYDVGTPAKVKRSRPNAAVDGSYDVAVSAVFESRAAFEAFLKHPDYVGLAQQVLRPLVDKYQVYEFVEP